MLHKKRFSLKYTLFAAEICDLYLYVLAVFSNTKKIYKKKQIKNKKKIPPLCASERSGLILSGCLVTVSSHNSSVHFHPPLIKRMVMKRSLLAFLSKF